ncbi:MAG: ATP-binding protein [Alphaproteobacteria bacterium]|nr:MAG: ATP-binding protein [Alphaproteobacteria bacterium]
MSVMVEMGVGDGGAGVAVDLEELLATRLLVQGNSGSGKSHLLRRLLEKSAGLVQQIVIDPEGDFVSLGDSFGHAAIEASGYSMDEIARMAARVREHRASVVLSLEGLETDAQMRCAAVFLSALFDAPREHWYPALVVVDEAQVFAPAVAGEVSDDARKASLSAMTNLMCRGRKRGLAGIIATQRLAKLAKNVAAEASNFLMGRTFLDIDMARAADLLGMERRQAEQIRDLERGQFLALGPALSRRPVNVRIGPVETSARSSSPKLMPLPMAGGGGDLFAGLDQAPPPAPPPRPEPKPAPAQEVIRAIEAAEAPRNAEVELDEEGRARVIALAIGGIADEPGAAGQPLAALYQDFQVRCRMMGVRTLLLDQGGFGRRLALARAGIADDGSWDAALGLAAVLHEDMLPVFLALANAARYAEPCPAEEELARIYGTSSLGRVRRVLSYIEEQGIIATRVDLTGRRSVSVPALGWTTAPALQESGEKPRHAAGRRR